MGKAVSTIANRSVMTEARAFEVAQEYVLLRDQEKSIKERKELLATLLKSYALEHGQPDDKGSRYLESDTLIVGSQCKRSVAFKPTAIDWLKKKGFFDAIIVSESVDTKGVERHVDNGDISVSELEQQTEIKETYAIDVKVKAVMPTVEQVNVTAASAKTSSLFGKKGR